MTNSIDRQGILDNSTSIETTAKLLLNAFVKKNTDVELALHGIHREELINQTTTFLSQAQKIILNLSNTFNLTTDGFFENNNSISTSIPLNGSHNSDIESKTYSLSSVTLDDILQHRLTLKQLLLVILYFVIQFNRILFH